MNLHESLASIENNNYQPIFSANFEHRNPRKYFLDEIRSKTAKPRTTGTMSTVTAGSRVMSSQPTTSRSSRPISRLDTKRTISLSLRKSDKNDNDSESLNLSLFTLESEEFVINKEKYGKFNYSSYFERYMNRKAPVKIPQHLMPKIESEQKDNNELEPTIFEMLAPDESKNLYSLYDVTIARPPRIRSNSVVSKRSFTWLTSQHQVRPRRKSLESIIAPIKTHVSEIRKAVEKSLLAREDETEQQFDVRGIKGPKCFTLGLRWEQESSTQEVKKKKKAKPFSNVDSKLAPYLALNRQLVEPSTHKSESRKAIITNSIFKKEFVVYTNRGEVEINSQRLKRLTADSYLKMDDELQDRIRTDLKVNHGPIYFVQLTEENVTTYDKNVKKVPIAQKYFYVYKWLEDIQVKECQHFYQNPFVQHKMCGTDEISEISSVTAEPVDDHPVVTLNVGFRAQTRHKIDPFENPVNEAIVKKLPRKYRFDSNDCETQDKQTFQYTRDYKSMLRFNNNFSLNQMKSLSKTQNNHMNSTRMFELTKERLEKQKKLNDLLFAQTQLDLYIL